MPGLHLYSYGEWLCIDVRRSVPNEGVLVVHSNHVRLLAGTTDDGTVDTASERKHYGISLSAYGKTARGASSPATDKLASEIDIQQLGGRKPTAGFAHARAVIKNNGSNFVHCSETGGL